MKSKNSIHSKIHDHLVENYPLLRRNGALTNSSSLLGGGVIDSLGVMGLVLFVEQTFDVIVVENDLDPANFDTIDAIAEFVTRKRSAAGLPN